jgi:cytochrome c
MNVAGYVLAAAVLGLGLGSARVEAASPEDGQKIFKRTCATCHTIEPGKNRVGPSLHGVVGRMSGGVEGFKYSKAMADAHLTWNQETLDKYLTNPKTEVPGTKMIFAGLKKEEDRQNVIAYLETLK